MKIFHELVKEDTNYNFLKWQAAKVDGKREIYDEIILSIIQGPKKEKVMNLGRRIICLLIQYTNCLQKAATVEKWADVGNLVIAVCSEKLLRALWKKHVIPK